VILYPAVDILDGSAVRLAQGDFSARTVYDDDPVAAARTWVEEGARALHVVDLDGARAGEPRNLRALERIVAEAGVPVQFGGGLRDAGAVAAALRAGAERVVVGTAAYRDPAFLDKVVAAHGERVAVAVDVRGGRVTAAGWTEDTGETAEQVVDRLGGRGVRTFVYTDVDRDGMMEGPDGEQVARLAAAVDGTLVYSGGIGELSHLRALASLPLAGVIVGKALYERRFTVAAGQAALTARRRRWRWRP
jgi:phosphoribosylformimino-5-aminoimidazole carboxamide ribotide isomerase